MVVKLFSRKHELSAKLTWKKESNLVGVATGATLLFCEWVVDGMAVIILYLMLFCVWMMGMYILWKVESLSIGKWNAMVSDSKWKSVRCRVFRLFLRHSLTDMDGSILRFLGRPFFSSISQKKVSIKTNQDKRSRASSLYRFPRKRIMPWYKNYGETARLPLGPLLRRHMLRSWESKKSIFIWQRLHDVYFKK